MNKMVKTVALLMTLVASSFSQPIVSIKQIQQMPLDSLLVADILQGTVSTRWTLQRSPYYGQTVTINAVCVVPAYPRAQVGDPLGAITFTGRGWTMLLADTGANPYPWGGILVRANTADTADAAAQGFLLVQRGQRIKMTGRVDEFPAGSMISTTQFVPTPGQPIQRFGFVPVPDYVTLPVGDFYRGISPTGKMMYSTGEQWEGCLVNFQTPLIVNTKLNTTRGDFSVVDPVNNNQMGEYDGSKFFTLKGSSNDHPYPDTVWSVVYPTMTPPTGVDTLRGFITTLSTSVPGFVDGYRIAPLYRLPYRPGDVKFGTVLPTVSTHRRNPIVVPSDSAARISVKVTRQANGAPIASINLLYSISNNAFTTLPMTFTGSDTTYKAQIPQQPENTFVHYFIRVTDSLGNVVTLASSAFGAAASDTSQGFFFYAVLNRALTIRDIQYTPYINGRSGYLGAPVSVKGIVTADTLHLRPSPVSNGGATTWYIQDGNQPWNGIWVSPTVADSFYYLNNGDSVTVTGTVTENFDVTQLVGATVARHVTGRPGPQPVPLTTGTFGINVRNGTPAAEQYEGMLVRFTNARFSGRYPEFNDRREFEIDDGSGPMRVLRDGRHTFSNDTLDAGFGYSVFRDNDLITRVDGIIHYSFSRYKFAPRLNSDFGTIVSVPIDHDPAVPGAFALSQNYPNPFNPSTVIEYSLPTEARVRLKVFNILGQEVRTLVNDNQSPGTYKVRFDASMLASGVYFYSLHASGFVKVQKMLLLK